jgi:hypothetical protein
MQKNKSSNSQARRQFLFLGKSSNEKGKIMRPNSVKIFAMNNMGLQISSR